MSFENIKALFVLTENFGDYERLEIIDEMLNKHKFYYKNEYFKNFDTSRLNKMLEATMHSESINKKILKLTGENIIPVKKCINISNFVYEEIKNRKEESILSKRRRERKELENKKKIDKKNLIISSRGKSKSKNR